MAARRAARSRDAYVTPLDVELLSALEATGSIVQACARILITRDTGMYRLRRLARALAAPVVVSARGGPKRGGTHLTDDGRRILLHGVGPLRAAPRGKPRGPVGLNVLRGTWHSTPQPHVSLDHGPALFVTFAAREGEPVSAAIEPEAIVVARTPVRSSARNLLPGIIDAVREVDPMRAVLHVRVGKRTWLDAVVTPRSRSLLRLAPGVRVYLLLKATAVAWLR